MTACGAIAKTAAALAVCGLLAACVGDAPAPEEEELLLHVPSPDWRDQVIYFLMLDRFADGDPGNNDQGAGEYDPSRGSHYSGGDIQGVIDRLDYIEGLGATAVWTTPQVANQWWSSRVEYGGYHGYWATDFAAVDAHNGTMATWKRLSDGLHRRGMYLVQDIVVNHTGNFFSYDGEYDPDDTARNFVLLAPPDSPQPAPTQPPFHMIDRLDPEHAAADVYHWTPNIVDYGRRDHQFVYQLAFLADINTSNPVVIDTLKKTYADWIRLTGVDAFRIDTVRYVEPEFFRRFMHDQDGIVAAAAATGREDFLAFGEVFDTSPPFTNSGEVALAEYLGTPDDPLLPAVINFPLYAELNAVFAQGKPTARLAYRLEQHVTMLGDPWRTPTFIDNHDTSRFLAGGDERGLRQALATLFTIPGIPVVYQGTGQMHLETRRAMFAGGYGTTRDHFDTAAPMYRFIRSLADLRKSDRALTRGSLAMLASEANGPGLVAWTRAHDDRRVLVLMNTASHRVLVGNLQVGDGPGVLEVKLLEGMGAPGPLDETGAWSGELDAGAILIAEVASGEAGMRASGQAPTIADGLDGRTLTGDTLVSGTARPGASLALVLNGNLDRAVALAAGDDGVWSWTYPVRDLGRNVTRLEVYDPEEDVVSLAANFETVVETPAWERSWTDPAGDDTGPTGRYERLRHEAVSGQTDLTGARIRVGGDTLELTIELASLTDSWLPPNGFDNVSITSFVDLPDRAGGTVLPMIDARMPEGLDWDIGHVAYGWGNYAYSPDGAAEHEAGRRYPVAPTVRADKASRSVTFTFRGRDYGVDDWRGARFYVTTWDIAGEGDYRELQPRAEDWAFGGGRPDEPKILDQMLIGVGE